MDQTTVWQYGSNNSDNADNLEAIREWWGNLKGIKVDWQQRLLPQDANPHQLNWEPQKFDETFAIVNPEMRGITLYWYKPDSTDERNMTPAKLELDTRHQQLYIYPQSQQQVVVRVTIPEVRYETVEIHDPHIAVGKNGLLLLFRDKEQLLDIKITLSPEKLQQLKEKLL